MTMIIIDGKRRLVESGDITCPHFTQRFYIRTNFSECGDILYRPERLKF